MPSLRSRQYMFEQQLQHIKIKINDLPLILEQSGATEWAYITHNQDIKDNGDPVDDHIHVVLKFDNPHTVQSVAKLFKDNDQQVTPWKGRINNAYSYLIHATADASNKHRYSVDEVTASFDYATRMTKIAEAVDFQDVDEALDMLANDIYTVDVLRKAIGIRAFAKKRKQIDDIQITKLEVKHQEWQKSFAGKKMAVFWIWGLGGTGKTSLAHDMTQSMDVAILGSANDYFQEYHGENVIIINDLRPDDLKWADLLRILDPFEHNKQAPRRYHNVPLNLELVIIATPFSPQTFYHSSTVWNRQIDTYVQLKRRLSQVIHLDEFNPYRSNQKVTINEIDDEFPF